MSTNCHVCYKEVHKYKCPKCNIKYCSVPCFKIHKENQCDPELQQLQKPSFREDKIPDKINVFETVDTVPADKLEELKNSEKLKELLKNKHLRDFLKQVNCAGNSWKAMQAAMSEPLFLEFADECLNIVEEDKS